MTYSTFYVCFSESERTCGSAHKTPEAAQQCNRANIRDHGDAPRAPYPVDAEGMFQARKKAAKAWGFTQKMRDRFIKLNARRGLPLYNREVSANPDTHVLSSGRKPGEAPKSPELKKTPETKMPDNPQEAALAALSALLTPQGPSNDEIQKQVETAIAGSIADLKAELLTGVKTIHLDLTGLPEGDPPKMDGLVHETMPALLQEVALGNSCWLAGPAGSGKTHAAEQVAHILGREFFIVGQILDAHADVVGYNDAHGNFMETPLYKWATSKPGSVLVLDEIDGSDPNALLKACAIFAKGTYTWPNGKTTAIPDEHILIACANTWGQGAEDGFTGREAIDGATTNRFPTRLAWGVDPELERAIVLSLYKDKEDAKKAGKAISACQIIRRNLEDAGFQGCAWGPRDTTAAAKRFVAGMDPFKTSLIATLDERQTKLAMKGVTLRK